MSAHHLDDTAVARIKQDINVMYKMLELAGYSLEKRALRMGTETYVFKLPGQKTGCMNVWQGDDGTVFYKDYSPYVTGGGTVIDFVMNARHLPNNSSGINSAINEIKDAINLNTSSSDYKPLLDTKRIQEILNSAAQDIEKTDTSFKVLKRNTQFKMESLEKYYPKIAAYLKERKIESFKKIDLFKTEKEFTNKKGEVKTFTKTMIGIPYGINMFYPDKEKKEALNEIPKAGAELRDINVDPQYKTRSWKPNGKRKTPSLLISKIRERLIIFESIFDYLCLQSSLDMNKTDIAILNGTGMVIMFINEIMTPLSEMDKEALKTYDEIIFAEQNDKPGKVATIQMLPFFGKTYPSTNFKIMRYKKSERGFDINDLMIKSNMNANEIINERMRPFNIEIYKAIVMLERKGKSYEDIYEILKKNSTQQKQKQDINQPAKRMKVK